MMDRVLEQKLAYWGKVLEITGDYVDVAQEADDFAVNLACLISLVSQTRQTTAQGSIDLFILTAGQGYSSILVERYGRSFLI